MRSSRLQHQQEVGEEGVGVVREVREVLVGGEEVPSHKAVEAGLMRLSGAVEEPEVDAGEIVEALMVLK